MEFTQKYVKLYLPNTMLPNSHMNIDSRKSMPWPIPQNKVIKLTKQDYTNHSAGTERDGTAGYVFTVLPGGKQ